MSSTTTISSKPGRHIRPLIALGIVYAAWLLWLAYLGWVNTQAGNQ